MPNTYLEYVTKPIIYKTIHKPAEQQTADINAILHTHDHLELFIWTSPDPLHFLLGDTMYRLTTGSILVVSPGTEHYAYTDIGNAYTRVKIGIPSSTLALFGDYENVLKQHGNTVFLASPADLQTIHSFCAQIENSISEKGYMPEEMELSVILGCMQLLLLAYRLPKETDTLTKKSCPQLLRDILRYIHEDNRFLRIRNTREIAEHFYISETYIPRLFRQFYPLSLHQLLLTKKIEYAKSVLCAGYSVMDTCYEAGFTDCAYFISVFKKYTGMTPGAYKNRAISHTIHDI